MELRIQFEVWYVIIIVSAQVWVSIIIYAIYNCYWVHTWMFQMAIACSTYAGIICPSICTRRHYIIHKSAVWLVLLKWWTHKNVTPCCSLVMTYICNILCILAQNILASIRCNYNEHNIIHSYSLQSWSLRKGDVIHIVDIFMNHFMSTSYSYSTYVMHIQTLMLSYCHKILAALIIVCIIIWHNTI